MEFSLTGTQLNYYFVCKRKLWLFSHNISFESYSDLVKIGKVIDRDTFQRKKKNIRIGNISIDHMENGVIHEVKKSDKIHDAHAYQLLYYIYCLGKLGMKTTGVINYPELKKTVAVELTDEKRQFLENVIQDASDMISGPKPPPAEYKPICDKCAYAEYCWS